MILLLDLTVYVVQSSVEYTLRKTEHCLVLMVLYHNVRFESVVGSQTDRFAGRNWTPLPILLLLIRISTNMYTTVAIIPYCNLCLLRHFIHTRLVYYMRALDFYQS